MRRLGVHTSIAGGLHLSLRRASSLGCTTMQIFTHNPRGWATKPISDEEADAFKKLRAELGIDPVYAHASYLINIASPDRVLREKSARLLMEELQRADTLGVDYVVLHTGIAHDAEAMRRASRVLRDTLRRKKTGAGLLLENTSGKKGDIASGIKDIAHLIEESGDRVAGVCIDSCHAFSAGYDIRHRRGLKSLGEELENTIGLQRVKLIHLNDSKGDAGSRIDRHEHLGRGMIGLAALKRFAQYGQLSKVPIVLETPKKSEDDDLENLRALKEMLSA